MTCQGAIRIVPDKTEGLTSFLARPKSSGRRFGPIISSMRAHLWSVERLSRVSEMEDGPVRAMMMMMIHFIIEALGC